MRITGERKGKEKRGINEGRGNGRKEGAIGSDEMNGGKSKERKETRMGTKGMPDLRSQERGRKRRREG